MIARGSLGIHLDTFEIQKEVVGGQYASRIDEYSRVGVELKVREHREILAVRH